MNLLDLVSNKAHRPQRTWGLILLAGLAVPLVAHMLRGTTMRYAADDYDTIYFVKTAGFWGSQVYWYTNWSGRFVFFFLVAVCESIGVGLVPWLPTLAIAGLTAACTWLVGELLPDLRRLTRLTLTMAWVGVAINLTPNIRQSLYWQTGMLTYFLPVIGMVVFCAWVLFQLRRPDRLPRWLAIGGSALWPFLAAGCAETAAAYQVAFIAALLLWSWLPSAGPRFRLARPYLWAGLIGALLATAVVMAAPGNAIRRTFYPPAPELPVIIANTVWSSLRLIYTLVRTEWVILLLALTGGLLTAWWARPAMKLDRFVWWALPLGGLMGILAAAGPAFVSLAAEPPERVLVIPLFWLSFGFAGWGLGLGQRWQLPANWSPRWQSIGLALILVALLLAGPWRDAVKTVRSLPGEWQLARQWDQRDQTLRAAGQTGLERVEVPYLPEEPGLEDLRADPDFILNQRAAGFYGVGEIVAR